jgi:hypothetical protein
MKTLVFLDHTGMHVELLTDLIDSNKQFTVYQVKEYVGGIAQLGFTDETIAKGVDFKVDEYDLGEMIEFAQEHDFTLIAMETGAENEVLYLAYYYGEAIGGGLI